MLPLATFLETFGGSFVFALTFSGGVVGVAREPVLDSVGGPELAASEPENVGGEGTKSVAGGEGPEFFSAGGVEEQAADVCWEEGEDDAGSGRPELVAVGGEHSEPENEAEGGEVFDDNNIVVFA